METRSLGNTQLQVSKLCLGTMTWGEQNTEAQAHEQMDYALANGINFFDVAEMYVRTLREPQSALLAAGLKKPVTAKKSFWRRKLPDRPTGYCMCGAGHN